MRSPGTRHCWWFVFAACAAAPPPTAAAPAVVPADVPPALRPFLGEHRGLLQMFPDRGRPPVAMGLDVVPIDGEPGRLRWVLRYGDGDRQQVRDYRLLVDDADAGRYRIDEQNGIVLDAWLHGGELISVFAAGGQTLVVRYQAVADGVRFGLEAFASDGHSPAGSAAASGSSPPEVAVTTWRQFTCQRADLRRQRSAGR